MCLKLDATKPKLFGLRQTHSGCRDEQRGPKILTQIAPSHHLMWITTLVFSLSAHLTLLSTSQSVHFHLLQFWQGKRFFNETYLCSLPQALIISRLDYCNSVLSTCNSSYPVYRHRCYDPYPQLYTYCCSFNKKSYLIQEITSYKYCNNFTNSTRLWLC